MGVRRRFGVPEAFTVPTASRRSGPVEVRTGPPDANVAMSAPGAVHCDTPPPRLSRDGGRETVIAYGRSAHPEGSRPGRRRTCACRGAAAVRHEEIGRAHV